MNARSDSLLLLPSKIIRTPCQPKDTESVLNASRCLWKMPFFSMNQSWLKVGSGSELRWHSYPLRTAPFCRESMKMIMPLPRRAREKARAKERARASALARAELDSLDISFWSNMVKYHGIINKVHVKPTLIRISFGCGPTL